MNALILAAGYATRLYPLTKDFPKPLLQVGDRTILDHLLDQVESLAALKRIVLVTNHRFLPHFDQWLKTRSEGKPLTLLDDGTISNENRLGAVGDLHLALEQGGLDDDLLVTAADNILRLPTGGLCSRLPDPATCQLCVHRVDDPGSYAHGHRGPGHGRPGVGIRGKTRTPKSNWGVPPLYLFPRAALRRVGEFLVAGGSPEAPGHFIQWLYRVEPVFAWHVSGSIIDIGTLESLAVRHGRYWPKRAMLERDGRRRPRTPKY